MKLGILMVSLVFGAGLIFLLKKIFGAKNDVVDDLGVPIPEKKKAKKAKKEKKNG